MTQSGDFSSCLELAFCCENQFQQTVQKPIFELSPRQRTHWTYDSQLEALCVCCINFQFFGVSLKSKLDETIACYTSVDNTYLDFFSSKFETSFPALGKNLKRELTF